MDETLETETPIEEEKEDKVLKSLKFKPLKDIILFLVAAVVIVTLFLASFLTRPDTSKAHVVIYYNDVQLWDKNDPEKNKEIQFPSEGEKKVEFLASDGPTFLGSDKDFVFEGNFIIFTLYSDHSIQVVNGDSECKGHDCIKQGRIYDAGKPIVCLPNHMRAFILGETNTDQDNSSGVHIDA
jgi:hypothetical protein